MHSSQDPFLSFVCKVGVACKTKVGVACKTKVGVACKTKVGVACKTAMCVSTVALTRWSHYSDQLPRVEVDRNSFQNFQFATGEHGGLCFNCL